MSMLLPAVLLNLEMQESKEVKEIKDIQDKVLDFDDAVLFNEVKKKMSPEDLALVNNQ